jgi:hypothetical protein
MPVSPGCHALLVKRQQSSFAALRVWLPPMEVIQRIRPANQSVSGCGA